MNLKECSIGIIGLGQMGGGISSNLVKAGYNIIGYDKRKSAVSKLIDVGGKSAESADEIVDRCEIIITCIEGKDSVNLADTILIPKSRCGQIYIDHSTVPAPQTRRIGQSFIEKGCKYLDAPISGGKMGAETGSLRIFVGGERSTFEQCLELFQVIGNPEKIVYCGPIGMGQVAKVVQQLTKRFPDLARLEVMVFGLRSGLDEEILLRALDVKPDSDDPYAWLYRCLKDGTIKDLSFAYAEWEYYLEEVRAKGFRMPMLEAMFEFCKNAEKTTADALGRPEPSIWNELMKK